MLELYLNQDEIGFFGFRHERRILSTGLQHIIADLDVTLNEQRYNGTHRDTVRSKEEDLILLNYTWQHNFGRVDFWHFIGVVDFTFTEFEALYRHLKQYVQMVEKGTARKHVDNLLLDIWLSVFQKTEQTYMGRYDVPQDPLGRDLYRLQHSRPEYAQELMLPRAEATFLINK